MRNKPQAISFSLSLCYYSPNMSDDALFGITSSCILNSSACVSCLMSRILIGKLSFDIFNLKKDYQDIYVLWKPTAERSLCLFLMVPPLFSCLMHLALMTFPYCRILTHSSVNSILFHERSSVNRHLLAVLHSRLNESRSSFVITGNGLFIHLRSFCSSCLLPLLLSCSAVSFIFFCPSFLTRVFVNDYKLGSFFFLFDSDKMLKYQVVHIW